MTITYVNDLRLSEMATGDNSGTWGTVTNTNLELIGEALGYGTEAITTNADTHASVIADGATDPVRALYVEYTGTLDSACTITISPNTVNKVCFIENGTAGSQNIIISQGSGANVTIPPGDTKAVYLNGAGSGAAVVDAFASLSVVDLNVSGNLDVDGTANLDAVDIDGAVQIDATLSVGVNDTGYDVKFFGDTASAFMLWDASADDLILGGAAGLSVNSAALVTGVLTTTAATVFNGGFASNADSTMGTDKKLIFRDSAIHISSTADGDLSIAADDEIDITSTLIDINGAVDMSSTLDVTGAVTANAAIAASTFAASTSLNISRAQGSKGSPSAMANGQQIGALNYNGYTSSGGYRTGANIIASVTAGVSGDELPSSLLFGTTADGGNDPTTRMIIDEAGDIGIGTTAINARLDIDGAGGSPATSGTTQGGVFRIRNASNNNCLDMGQIAGSPYGSWIQATDVTDLSEKNPLYLNLNGGMVGLGTTSVESWTLNVAGTNFSSGGGLAVAAFRDTTAYNTSDNGAGIAFQGIYNSGGSYTNFATIQAGKLNNTDGNYSTYLRFLTRSNGASQAEAVRIDEAGTLLVGTTAKVNDGIQVNKFNGTSHNGLVLKTTRSATGTTFIAFVNSAGNFCGSVSQNGTTTVAFNTSSDQRLKENIADSDDSGSTIDAIKVRKFDWIDGGVHEKYGFIAQELKTVVPEAVSSLGLAAEDDPMLGVDQSKLIALAIKEIQLLRVRVAELETKVTALEG